jgi:hypothetical protein
MLPINIEQNKSQSSAEQHEVSRSTQVQERRDLDQPNFAARLANLETGTHDQQILAWSKAKCRASENRSRVAPARSTFLPAGPDLESNALEALEQHLSELPFPSAGKLWNCSLHLVLCS